MRLRPANPAFLEAMQRKGVEVNKASRVDMRSYLCGQSVIGKAAAGADRAGLDQARELLRQAQWFWDTVGPKTAWGSISRVVIFPAESLRPSSWALAAKSRQPLTLFNSHKIEQAGKNCIDLCG